MTEKKRKWSTTLTYLFDLGMSPVLNSPRDQILQQHRLLQVRYDRNPAHPIHILTIWCGPK